MPQADSNDILAPTDKPDHQTELHEDEGMDQVNEDGVLMDIDIESLDQESLETPTGIPMSDRNAPNETDTEQVEHDALFVEFFAGCAVLTDHVAKLGVPTETPEDLELGGADFSKTDDIEYLKTKLAEHRHAGKHLVVHFAPPCATFSRARDRSHRTRLRSRQRPQGLLGKGLACREANIIARNTLNLAEWCAKELHAAVSIENPRSSYLWSFLEFDPELPFVDVDFCPCMFGADYYKPTKLRCWNWAPRGLGKVCTLKAGNFTCGKSRSNPHVTLEFGGASTKEAAAYHEGVCEAWAREILAHVKETYNPKSAVATALAHDEGRVHRHAARGGDVLTEKEKRNEEDANSAAGMRNPAAWEKYWPELWSQMAMVRQLFLTARSCFPDVFTNLAECLGNNPKRAPPPEGAAYYLRHLLEILFDAPRGLFHKHHEASEWRYGLVRYVQTATADPDKALSVWLERGAPMGLDRPIEPGGLFPPTVTSRGMSVESLDKIPPKTENHASFDELLDESVPPAWTLLTEQVEKGHALLFESAEAAENALGGKVHPAPLGNVTKLNPDGKRKNRLIQDLRANLVNTAVELPERQVLPRGIDHGRDLALLSAERRPEEDVYTMILDYKDAFMSVPLASLERRFNCANTGFDLQRTRPPLYEDEPAIGRFVVWRVLGFGGKPNPLVFSRGASFASRTAQALLGPLDRREREGDRSCVGVAPGRVQLYVDDPAVAVVGTFTQANLSFDLVVMWWMELGIPLSLKKGEMFDGATPHRWIGIMYHVVEAGALMRLPPAFLEELAELLSPLCRRSGTVSIQDLEQIVGKAARVAHVVPSAKPFVAGLWGGLGAAKAARSSGLREAPPNHVACRRVCFSASWLRALILDDQEQLLPLERLVTPSPPASESLSGWSIEFDASPFGGGAVLKDSAGHITEFFSTVWLGDEAEHLSVAPADPAFQTFWEFATLLLSLITWGGYFTDQAVLILGDNIGALSNALALKGRGILLNVARELAWRQARRGWKFSVGHLPSEFNVVADALSRWADPKKHVWPATALAGARQVSAPKLKDVWKAQPA